MSSSVSWAAPIYSSVFPPWKFWRQENKRYYSATGGPAQHPPPPPPLPPTTISDLQSILKLYSNKYYLINPPNTQTLSSLLSPIPACRTTDEPSHLSRNNYEIFCRLVGQFHNGPTVILLNYILQPSAENRSILQCCPVSSQ